MYSCFTGPQNSRQNSGSSDLGVFVRLYLVLFRKIIQGDPAPPRAGPAVLAAAVTSTAAAAAATAAAEEETEDANRAREHALFEGPRR